MSDHEEPRGRDERYDARTTDEDRAWLESDLGGISEFEPYDEWAEGEMEAGEPVRYVPGIGAVAGGEEEGRELRERLADAEGRGA